MNRKLKIILLVAFPLLGIIAGYLLMARQVTVTVDGVERVVTTHALTVRGALASADVALKAEDEVHPAISSWLTRNTRIVVKISHAIQVWNDSNSQLIPVDAVVSTPLEILAAAGIRYREGDLLRINGQPVVTDQPLNHPGRFVLQYTPSSEMTITTDGHNSTFRSSAFNYGMAAWQQGIRVHNGDALNVPFTSRVEPGRSWVLNRAVPLMITVDGKVVSTSVAASTVGEALGAVGISLQDLDYSKPDEGDPLPADGRIEVVRVRQELVTEEQKMPYKTQTIIDDSLGANQTRINTAGEFGLQIARFLVQFENGSEVSRTTLESVILKQPVDEVKAVGSKVTVQNTTTSDGPVDYYLAMEVTATTYSPCNSGVDECIPLTAMGTPVQKGVIAVTPEWYKILKGTQIYVPGYGIGRVEDTGRYDPNPHWIDLGYTDAEYAVLPSNQKFFRSITVYFLGPFPNGLVLP